MKRFLLAFFLLSGFVFAQTTVKTVPSSHSWGSIYDGALNGALVYTNAMSIGSWEGALTLFCDLDSTDAEVTHSTVAVYMQYYSVNLGLWCGEYTTAGDSIAVGTIAASKWLIPSNRGFAIEIGETTEWMWADSVRFIFTPAAADSGTLKVYPGGI